MALGLVLATPSLAAELENPCVRVLVPEMSPALVWTGPPIDDVDPQAWTADAEVAEMVGQVTDRRLSPAEVQAAIDRFAESLGAERDRRLTLLFSGAFHTLQSGRTKSLDAIQRYVEGQKLLLDRVAGHLRSMRELPEESAERAAVEESLTADRRILEERRRLLTAVCDRPVLFEQRLGIIARAIAPHLGQAG